MIFIFSPPTDAANLTLGQVYQGDNKQTYQRVYPESTLGIFSLMRANAASSGMASRGSQTSPVSL